MPLEPVAVLWSLGICLLSIELDTLDAGSRRNGVVQCSRQRQQPENVREAICGRVVIHVVEYTCTRPC